MKILKLNALTNRSDIEKAFKICSKGSTGLSQDIRDDSIWWIAVEGRTPIGCVGSFTFSKGHIRYKQDCVRPDKRGLKVYTKLFEARDNYYSEDSSVSKYSAVCTPMSAPMYLKKGFSGKIGKDGKHRLSRI